MRTKFLFLIPIFIICVSASAQYSSAVGLRLGYPTSITYKKFLNDNNAIEIFGGLRGYGSYSSINLSGLYQIHKDIDEVENLRYYYGGGAGVFLWRFNNDFIGDDSGSTSIALHGVLGLDYHFDDFPLNVSIDWLPTFLLNGYGNGFGAGYTALSGRYILGSKK